ncbi:hypothetical protein TURU_095623 [Turdus rufiventris]|nr:hypothetical protein TURU_095623 [Turdus rufiventris]
MFLDPNLEEEEEEEEGGEWEKVKCGVPLVKFLGMFLDPNLEEEEEGGEWEKVKCGVPLVKPELWQKCLGCIEELLELLFAHPEIFVGENVLEESENLSNPEQGTFGDFGAISGFIFGWISGEFRVNFG